MNRSKVILLVSILIFQATLTTIPRLTSTYPLHIDEWHHIALARNIIEDGPLYNNNLEIGFQLFLVGVSNLGIDLIQSNRYLAIGFSVITSICIFLLMYYLTKNFYIAAASSLFLASLKSNVNILGPWFFIPMTFAFPFIYLFFFLFFKAKEGKKPPLYLLMILDYLILLVVHPISAAIVFLILFVYLLLNYKTFSENKLIPIIVISIPVLTISVFFGLMWHWSTKIQDILSYVIFKRGWGVYEKVYSIPQFYGYVATFFAIVGTIIILSPIIHNQLNKFFQKNKRKYKKIFSKIKSSDIKKFPVMRIFLIWVIIAYSNMLLYLNAGFTILIPYQRSVYYMLLGLVPLSAIGAYHFSLGVYGFLNHRWKRASMTLMMVLLILTIFSLFFNYFDLPTDVRLYELIEKEDFEAIKFLEEREKGVVLSTPQVGSTIYPLSGQNVVVSLRFEGSDDLRTDVRNFFNLNCSAKNEFTKEKDVRYVLSKKSINCSWEEIYNDNTFIYELE
jgi:hypothetical protein